MAHGLLEHKSWGAHLGSIVSDVADEFRPLYDPSDVVAEIVGDISMQLILCSDPERYVKIGRRQRRWDNGPYHCDLPL